MWTEKGSKILWMADRLRAGVVWANTFNRFDPGSPFGGFQESGFGREGGVAGLFPYVHLERTGVSRRPDDRRAGCPVREDVQAVHQRRVPALGVGAHVPRARRLG